GVLADRGVLLDERQRHHPTRVVELHLDHLAYPDTVKVHAAAVAQARRGALEDDPQRAALLGGVEALKPENKAERGRNHGQREGPDQDIVRPRFHQLPRTRPRCSFAASGPSLIFLPWRMIPSENRSPRFGIMLWLAHHGAGALAVEILPQPRMLRCLHVGNRSCCNDLTVP